MGSLENYCDLKIIQDGTNSAVYKAYDIKNSRHVAIKIYKENKKSTKYIKKEQLLIKHNHKSIIKIYETFVSKEGKSVVVMEYIRGLDLFYYIESFIHSKLKEEKAKKIIRPLLSALLYLKQNKIIHSDIKLENVLLETYHTHVLRVVLTDFGLSYFDIGEFGKVDGFSGTLEYICPETYSSRIISYANDIWAVGVLYYILITGYYPFDGKNESVIEYKILTKELDIPKSVSLPSRNILNRMLDKNMNTRITVEELIDLEFF